MSEAGQGLKLSVVIPAHNEEGCVRSTVESLYQALVEAGIPHEILVINDNSTDATEEILRSLSQQLPTLRYVNNAPPNGYGFAVRRGLLSYSGDAVAIYMADASDSPADLVAFYRRMVSDGVDCVFGSRFMSGSRVIDYPWFKLILNRLANTFVNVLFGLGYNDVTNAFKLFRRHVIEGLNPLIAHHFNLTVELPLKAIIRGFTFSIVPNSWTNRKAGISKLKIKEMGSRYLFIVLYCLIEKWLSRGDYKRRPERALEPAALEPATIEKSRAITP
jgi:dolichol-phosphate mannosyltransferase